MALFISRFSGVVPWRLAMALATMVAAWLACAFYTFEFDPELGTIHYVYRQKLAFARQLDQSPTPKMVFAGGSSCAHQINTELLNGTYRLPSVNLGQNAGLGFYVNTAIGISQVRPGDSLVLAIEPSTFADATITKLGYEFTATTRVPKLRAGLAILGANFTRREEINAMRPGLYHLVTLMAKIALRQPLDRMKPTDLKPDGYEDVTDRRNLVGLQAGPVELPPATQQALRQLVTWAAQNHVRVAYLMPWGYYHPGDEAKARIYNREFLLKMASIMPVLRDEKLGVWDRVQDFADTEVHLDPDGAARRTEYLAPILTQWQTFDRSELADSGKPQ
ncbi:MAG TPA: hypothetical protein VHY09_08730 [Candidatus Methylacidiphilales bacterium]|jgi:hypothetical protein|nr:hypothetical protein [Candidatus Methylacidiphilales bacterium]